VAKHRPKKSEVGLAGPVAKEVGPFREGRLQNIKDEEVMPLQSGAVGLVNAVSP
jgi:hypothetical protein